MKNFKWSRRYHPSAGTYFRTKINRWKC